MKNENRFMIISQNDKPKGFFYVFFHHKLGVCGLCGILLFILMAIFAPMLGDMPQGYGDFSSVQLAPSAEHFFGTDAMGLDVFLQVVWGARTSIRMGLMVVLSVSQHIYSIVRSIL